VTISATALPIVAAALESSGTLVAVFEAQAAAPLTPCFKEASGAFLHFCGYGENELAGRTLACLAAPAAAAWPAIESALKNYMPYRGDLACRAKDGTQKWLGLHLMPVNDTPGGMRRYVLIGRDITAQRKESAQARVVQGLLLKSFMVFDHAIAMVAADDRIVMANTRLETLLGSSAGSLAGGSALDLILPPYRQLVRDARAVHVAEGESTDVHAELRPRDGAPFPAALRFTRLNGPDAADVATMVVRPLEHGTSLPARLRMAGKIRFISLDTVRAELKDRWESVAARVLDTAEQRIRRRLRPEDMLSRTADKGFTICFADATEEEASEIAAAVARDIRQHLIGNGEDAALSQLSAMVSQVAVPASDMPDMQQIGRHLLAAQAEIDAVPWPDPIAEAVIGATDGAPAASFIRIEPPRRNGIGRLAFPDSTLEQDLAALRAAAALTTQNSVLVDVGFTTFLNRSAMDHYLQACINLPLTLRERLYLVFSPLPKGTTQSLLQDLMRRLSRSCAGFAVRLDDLRPPEFEIATCRPAVAVVDMRRWEGGTSVPTDRLHRVTSLMHSYRVRVLALGVSSVETGHELLRAGVDWLTLEHTAL